MKIQSKILALCVFHHSVLGINAFSVQQSNPFTLQPLYSLSYLNGLTGSEISEKTSTVLRNAIGDQVSQSVSYSDAPSETIQSPVAGGLAPTPEAGGLASLNNIWETSDSVIVQGGSLRTWSTPNAQRVQLSMSSEGRPMNANIELWQGPDNTPQKMNIYIEDGNLRPLNAVIETPRGPNSVALYNTGQLEFPFNAVLEADGIETSAMNAPALADGLRIIQGGALKTFPFGPAVGSIQVLIKTDGRPLNARIELLQGPNNQKQVMDIYTEDGLERPFFAVIETPGSGNVVRVLNTAPMEYPMSASVQPFLVKNESYSEGWR